MSREYAVSQRLFPPWLVAVALLLGVCTARADPVTVIPPGFDQDNPVLTQLPYVYFKDVGDRVAIDSLLQHPDPLDDARWQRATKNRMPERYSESYYWLATKITNKSGEAQSLIYDYAHPRQRYLDLYVLHDNGTMERFETGTMRPFSQRPIEYSNFAFPIRIDNDETVTLFAHVKNRPQYMVTHTRLFHPIAFVEFINRAAGLQYIYVGALSAIVVYALIIALYMREKIYTYFLFVVGASLYGMVVFLGPSPQVLGYDLSGLLDFSDALAATLYSVATLLFVDEFCHFRQVIPRWRRFMFGLCAIIVLLLAASFITNQPLVLVNYTLALLGLLTLIVFGFCVRLAIEGSQPARWLAAAWFCSLAGIVTWFVLRSVSNESNQHVFALGQIAQVVVMSFAVFKRLTDLRDEAQVAHAESRAKGDFLAQMSHEIRNPMNGVLGMTQLLQDTPLNHVQKQYTNVIQSSASALLTILNDILDISKMEAGKLRIESIAFDMYQLSRDCVRMFEQEAKAKQLTLDCHIDPDVPRYIYGDPNRIRQILVNLLSNAFKFTESGRIALDVSLDSARPLKLKLSVSDTGIGIEPAQRERLFEHFQQADISISRKFGGTGLGLAICKQLSELMNGDIGVESTPARGSTFWVTFATCEASADELPQPLSAITAQTPRRTLKVLVAEDNQVNQLVVRRLLEKMGHQCTLVDNGQQALEAYRRGVESPSEPFDLILMDVDMPVMDGLQATRRLREFEREVGLKRTPVVALTAHMMPEYVARCRDAGMDAHLSKPVQYNELFRNVEQFCRVTVDTQAMDLP